MGPKRPILHQSCLPAPFVPHLRGSPEIGQDEILPMTPYFAELIQRTSEGERVGRVFILIDQGTDLSLEPHRIGEIVGKIGRKAKVVTNKSDGKYAGNAMTFGERSELGG